MTCLFNLKDKCLTLGSSAVWKQLESYMRFFPAGENAPFLCWKWEWVWQGVMGIVEFLGRMEGQPLWPKVSAGVVTPGVTQGTAKPCEQAAGCGYFKVQHLGAARGFQFSVSDAILSKALIQRHNFQPEIHGGFFTAFISAFPFIWRLGSAEISSSGNSLGALCGCLPAFLMGKKLM